MYNAPRNPTFWPGSGPAGPFPGSSPEVSVIGTRISRPEPLPAPDDFVLGPAVRTDIPDSTLSALGGIHNRRDGGDAGSSAPPLPTTRTAEPAEVSDLGEPGAKLGEGIVPQTTPVVVNKGDEDLPGTTAGEATEAPDPADRPGTAPAVAGGGGGAEPPLGPTVSGGVNEPPRTPEEWASMRNIDVEAYAKEWFENLDWSNPETVEAWRQRIAAVHNYDLENPVLAEAVEHKMARIALWQSVQQVSSVSAEMLDSAEYREGRLHALEFVGQTFGHVRDELISQQKEIDALTGLDRYNTFLAKLEARYGHPPRETDIVEIDGQGMRPLLVLAVDGDEFKDINDRLGHTVGDKAIQQMATPFKNLRQSDLKTRRGGDEFMAAIGGMDREQATNLCDRFSTELADGLEMPLPGGGFIRFTATTAAVWSPNITSFAEASEVLEFADQALIRIKDWFKRHPNVPRRTPLIEFNPQDNTPS